MRSIFWNPRKAAGRATRRCRTPVFAQAAARTRLIYHDHLTAHLNDPRVRSTSTDDANIWLAGMSWGAFRCSSGDTHVTRAESSRDAGDRRRGYYVYRPPLRHATSSIPGRRTRHVCASPGLVRRASRGLHLILPGFRIVSEILPCSRESRSSLSGESPRRRWRKCRVPRVPHWAHHMFTTRSPMRSSSS